MVLPSEEVWPSGLSPGLGSTDAEDRHDIPCSFQSEWAVDTVEELIF